MLQKSASTKYLVVLLDNELDWVDHVSKTVEKANRRLGARWGSKQDAVKVTYNTYVKPIMKYSSEVIVTTNKAKLNCLEIVQNNA